MSRSPIYFTDEEIEQRLAVWTALSDIFVNVEQSPEEADRHLDYIARNLMPLGIPISELETILRDEIGPFFIGNFSIWNPFPETEFWNQRRVEAIMKNFRAQRNTLDGLVQRLFKKDPFKNETVSSRWAGIRDRLRRMGLPES